MKIKLILLLISVFIFTACTNTEVDTKPEPDPNEKSNVTIGNDQFEIISVDSPDGGELSEDYYKTYMAKTQDDNTTDLVLINLKTKQEEPVATYEKPLALRIYFEDRLILSVERPNSDDFSSELIQFDIQTKTFSRLKTSDLLPVHYEARIWIDDNMRMIVVRDNAAKGEIDKTIHVIDILADTSKQIAQLQGDETFNKEIKEGFALGKYEYDPATSTFKIDVFENKNGKVKHLENREYKIN